MNKTHGAALAVVLGLMLSSFASAEEEEGTLAHRAANRSRRYSTGPGPTRPISTLLSLPGEVRAEQTAPRISCPAAGVVEAVKVNLGQAVKKGELLAVIASQHSDQRSELAASERRVELARTTFQRERQLWQDKISAEARLPAGAPDPARSQRVPE